MLCPDRAAFCTWLNSVNNYNLQLASVSCTIVVRTLSMVTPSSSSHSAASLDHSHWLHRVYRNQKASTVQSYPLRPIPCFHCAFSGPIPPSSPIIAPTSSYRNRPTWRYSTPTHISASPNLLSLTYRVIPERNGDDEVQEHEDQSLHPTASRQPVTHATGHEGPAVWTHFDRPSERVWLTMSTDRKSTIDS